MKYIIFALIIVAAVFIYAFIRGKNPLIIDNRPDWSVIKVELSVLLKDGNPVATLQFINTGKKEMRLELGSIGNSGYLEQDVFNITDEHGEKVPFIDKDKKRFDQMRLNKVTSTFIQPGIDHSLTNTINLANYYALDLDNHSYTIQYSDRQYFSVPTPLGASGGKGAYDIKSNTVVLKKD